ncbi:unnamed protein product, partial [Ectocarpus sp. 13 AM-2016]
TNVQVRKATSSVYHILSSARGAVDEAWAATFERVHRARSGVHERIRGSSITPPAAVSSQVPDPARSLASHSTHHRPSTATMFPTRSMIGALAMLLLSARLEAFSVRPVVTRRGSKPDSGSSGSGRALAPSAVSDRGTLAAASWLWTGASGSPRSTALRMGLETVTGLTSTDMQAREFQV